MEQEKEVMVKGVRPSTVAMFFGTFGLILGLAAVIVSWVGTTVNYSQATNSLLAGLLMGFAVGFLALIIVPIIYFAVGWVVGYLQGWVFNAVLGASEGIGVTVSGMDADQARMASPTRSSRAEPSFGEKIERDDEDR